MVFHPQSLYGNSEIPIPLLLIKPHVCHFKPGLITWFHSQASFSKVLTSHVYHNYKKQVSFCLFLSLSQSWEVSHLNQRQLLTLWCKAYFMLNMQTEIRLRCQFKIETMPSEKKGISFWLCMWVVLCRNGLGIVATVLLCWFFSVCKWGLSSVFIIN